MSVSSVFPKKRDESKARKQAYKEEYEAAKKGGEPFFPDTLFKDFVVSLIVFGVIILLALLVPIGAGALADPTSTTFNPRPEWYFLFLFEMLKFFPGSLESFAAIVLPGVGIIVIILLPFIDRRADRHPARRPAVTVVAGATVAGIVILSVLGATAPLLNAPEEDPLTIEGRRVYAEFQCNYCHAINGVGGAVGPDLAVVTKGLTADQIRQYLKNPNAMIPQTLHPKLQFTTGELQSLSSYVASLGAAPVFSADAPKLFQQYCVSCHAINGQGGKVGPDVGSIGTVRSPAYIQGFITNPKSILAGSTMPQFDKTLTTSQISDIANYLSSLRGPTNTPTPTLTTTVPAPSTTGAPTGVPTTTAVTTTGIPSPGIVSFSRDIQPIFQASCGPCHISPLSLGGLNLTTYTSTMTTGEHGPDIIRGNAGASLLYQVLNGPSSGVSLMPQGGALRPDKVKLIGDWINQGAAEN